jgi:hypothetical protein
VSRTRVQLVSNPEILTQFFCSSSTSAVCIQRTVHFRFAHAFSQCTSLGIRSNQEQAYWGRFGCLSRRVSIDLCRFGRPCIRRWSGQDHRQRRYALNCRCTLLIYIGVKNLVLDLILSLQILPAARLLPPRSCGANLLEDLFSFGSSIYSSNFDITSIVPLLTKVVDNELDAEIWSAVYDLVTQSTPPPRPLPNLDQTPYSFNTTSFVNSSEHRRHVDEVLKIELGPSLHIGVPDFYETFFGQIAGLETAAASVFAKYQKGNNPLYNQESVAGQKTRRKKTY